MWSLQQARWTLLLLLHLAAWGGSGAELQLAVSSGHEASATLARDGEVIATLELERLVGKRYFDPMEVEWRNTIHYHASGGRFVDRHFESFEQEWEAAVRVLAAEVNASWVDLAVCVAVVSSEFVFRRNEVIYGRDRALLMERYYRSIEDALKRAVERSVGVGRWVTANHHESHAAAGFYSSPFDRALVVSFDYGGNDGYFNVYDVKRADNTGQSGPDAIQLVERSELRLGELYTRAAQMFPEVITTTTDPRVRCSVQGLQSSTLLGERPASTGCVSEQALAGLSRDEAEAVTKNSACTDGNQRCMLALAGKFMGYAGTAHVAHDLLSGFEGYLRSSPRESVSGFVYMRNMYANSSEPPHETGPFGFEVQRALAATIQAAFERVVVSEVVDRLLPAAQARASQAGETLDGVVLSGGCALNVPANFKIATRLALLDSPLRLYVPPAPQDGGLSLGGLWAVAPPPQRVAPPTDTVQYTGLDLWDRADVSAAVRERGGVAATPAAVAARLLDGAIVGVVRGRSEFGPRALGHRSLLALPTDRAMLDRLNRLKHRQWYRPVAPMIRREDAGRCFGALWDALDEDGNLVLDAPYMSLAAELTPWCAARFPAIAHFDGTARPQTVTTNQEPWVHALLSIIAEQVEIGVLINTSFNVRGKPILNTLAEALALLDDPAAELDTLVIGEWLFDNSRKRGPIAGS